MFSTALYKETLVQRLLTSKHRRDRKPQRMSLLVFRLGPSEILWGRSRLKVKESRSFDLAHDPIWFPDMTDNLS